MRSFAEGDIQQADKLLCESWNERMWSDGEPLDPSPTIDQAVNRGFPWLEIQCARCKTPSDVDLAAMKRPPTTFVHDLARRSVRHFASCPNEIPRRIRELKAEWDIERAIEANASALAFTGTLLGATGDRRWFCAPGASDCLSFSTRDPRLVPAGARFTTIGISNSPRNRAGANRFDGPARRL